MSGINRNREKRDCVLVSLRKGIIKMLRSPRYRSLDRRLEKQELKIANWPAELASRRSQFGSRKPASLFPIYVATDAEMDRSDELNRLIGKLPEKERLYAEEIVEVARQSLSSAALTRRKLTKDLDTDTQPIVDALLARAKRDQLFSYLVRARCLEFVGDEWLSGLWVKVVRAQTIHPGFGEFISDIEAELALRGIDPPFESVQQDLKEVADKVGSQKSGEAKESLREEFHQLLDEIGQYDGSGQVFHNDEPTELEDVQPGNLDA